MHRYDVEYDPSMVLLSFAVAFLGSYLAVTFAEPLRTQSCVDKGCLFFMAVSLGGVGIFGMHFIGMSAVRIYSNDSHHRVDLKYSSTLTILSLVAVLMFGLGGVYLASLDPLFRKTKKEILEIFLEEAKTKSFSYARRISLRQMIIIITTKNLNYLLCGGITTGAGVCIMHYIGMLAMEHNLIMKWDVGLVIASVVIAVVASTAAFWILFRLLSAYSQSELLRLASALLMACAVCGMHYTGMAAVSFYRKDGYEPDVETTFTNKELSERVGVTASIVVLYALFMIAVIEQRVMIRRMRAHLKIVGLNDDNNSYALSSEGDASVVTLPINSISRRLSNSISSSRTKGIKILAEETDYEGPPRRNTSKNADSNNSSHQAQMVSQSEHEELFLRREEEHDTNTAAAGPDNGYIPAITNIVDIANTDSTAAMLITDASSAASTICNV